MADTYNIDVDQGTTHSFTVTYKDSGGTGIDMSGYTYKMDVRQGYKDSALEFSLSGGSGIDTTGESTGVLVITLSKTQTGGLTLPQYYYDLEITSASDETTRLIEGKILVKPEVTD